jgi:hypothetical protein
MRGIWKMCRIDVQSWIMVELSVNICLIFQASFFYSRVQSSSIPLIDDYYSREALSNDRP